MFYRTGVIADRSFTLREWEFSTFLAPVTLTLTRWPSYTNLTRIPWRYTACAKMNFKYVQSFESYRLTVTDRHTDRTEIIYHTAWRVVKNGAIATTCPWINRDPGLNQRLVRHHAIRRFWPTSHNVRCNNNLNSSNELQQNDRFDPVLAPCTVLCVPVQRRCKTHKQHQQQMASKLVRSCCCCWS